MENNIKTKILSGFEIMQLHSLFEMNMFDEDKKNIYCIDDYELKASSDGNVEITLKIKFKASDISFRALSTTLPEQMRNLQLAKECC